MKKYWLLVILAGVIILIVLLFQIPTSSTKEGTYLDENNVRLKCELELNKESSKYYFYDEDNNLIGTCDYISGPVPLGCGVNARCSSELLLSEPIASGECAGMRSKRYLCQVPGY